MKLKLASDVHNPCHVVAAGELRCNRNSVTDPLRSLIGSFASRRVLLNLRSIRSFDASGLAWLATSRQALQSAQGELVLLNAPASIRRALALLGLTTAYATADDATWASQHAQEELQ